MVSYWYHFYILSQVVLGPNIFSAFKLYVVTVFILFFFRVDFVKYPGLIDVEYYNVTMQAGDCLYIPHRW